MPPGDLTGEVVLVTGAAQGMGAAHAATLAARGARVAVTDVADEAGLALARKIGETAVYRNLDVTSADQWASVCDSVEADLGPITALVNNAGVFSAYPLAGYPEEEWRLVLDTNLTGTFLGVKTLGPRMASEGRGSIVNISSPLGLRGAAQCYAYSASKWGIRGVTKCAAIELGGSGVRVNTVHPGFIQTSMTDYLDATALEIPLRRGGSPEEVTAAIVFLVSADSSYVSGSEIVIDGGMTANVPRYDLEFGVDLTAPAGKASS